MLFRSFEDAVRKAFRSLRPETATRGLEDRITDILAAGEAYAGGTT